MSAAAVLLVLPGVLLVGWCFAVLLGAVALVDRRH